MIYSDIKNLRQYIGIPYEHHGRSGDGMDCYGITRFIYRNELNVELPDFEYVSMVKNEEFDIIHNDQWVKVPLEDLKTFDLMVFKNISHVGQVAIYIGHDRAIFTGKKAGSCIMHLSKERMRRLLGVYRWPG